MKVGIVGHEEKKFTTAMKAAAFAIIYRYIRILRPELIISGGCHLGGVDIWAEECADHFGIKKRIHKPRVQKWEGKHGFKARNLKIAEDSDFVLVIVVTGYHRGYDGMRFDGCYHCTSLRMGHVKSGACWTAMRAPLAKWEFVPVMDEPPVCAESPPSS